MATEEKSDSLPSTLIAIIAFLAGILSYIVQGWIGLVFVLVASLIILGYYYLYQYLSVRRWKRKAHILFDGLIKKDYLEWQQNVVELQVLTHDASNIPSSPGHSRLLSLRRIRAVATFG